MRLIKGLPEERLLDRIKKFNRVSGVSQRALGFYLLDFDRRRLYKKNACSSTVHFALLKLHIQIKKAQALLRVARALEGLPLIDAAFAAGRLPWSAVRELCRVAVKETEAEWLALAEKSSLRKIEALVRRTALGERPPRDPYGLTKAKLKVMAELPMEDYAVWKAAFDRLAARCGNDLDASTALYLLAKSYLNQPLTKGEEEARSAFQVVYHRCSECERAWVQTNEGPAGVPRSKVEGRELEAEVIRVEEAPVRTEAAVQAVVPVSAEAAVQAVVPVPAEAAVQAAVPVPVEAAVQAAVPVPVEVPVQAAVPIQLEANTGGYGRPGGGNRQDETRPSEVSCRANGTGAGYFGLQAPCKAGDLRAGPWIPTNTGDLKTGPRVPCNTGDQRTGPRVPRNTSDLKTGSWIQRNAGNLRTDPRVPRVTAVSRENSALSTPDTSPVPKEERDDPNTPKIRQQVLSRDGRCCALPGCQNQRRLSAHHVKWRFHGGMTAVTNEVCLCFECHGLIHEGIIKVNGVAPHGLEWRDRSGKLIVEPVMGPSLEHPLYRKEVQEPVTRVTAVSRENSCGGEEEDNTIYSTDEVPDEMTMEWWQKYKHNFYFEGNRMMLKKTY